MSDPFANAHRAAERKAIRRLNADHNQAIKEALARQVKEREADAIRGRNGDIGYRARPRFYEPGF
jgi:hypothetical protein